MSRVGSTIWKAKYPDFAKHDRTAISQPDDGSLPGEQHALKSADGTMRSLEWIEAPSTSNLHSFAFISARIGSPHFSRLQKILVVSQLHCRFKPKPKDNRVWHYTYDFTNDADGEAIFEAMKASPHPWGEVGYPRLVLGKVPYTRHA